MVSTHLKNTRPNGNLPQIGVKMKNIWNHHPALILYWYYSILLISYLVASLGTSCIKQTKTLKTHGFIPATSPTVWLKQKGLSKNKADSNKKTCFQPPSTSPSVGEDAATFVDFTFLRKDLFQAAGGSDGGGFLGRFRRLRGGEGPSLQN